MPIKLEKGGHYRTAAGDKVSIVAQVKPDAHGNAFVGSISGNGSNLYKGDGTCLADANCAITGLWIEDTTIYQPIQVNDDGSATILAERYADENQCRVEHKGKYIARVTTTDKVPSLTLLEPA